MRIATWNINGLRSRLDFVLGWLEARRPDVVGLQELKLTADQFPRSKFESVGYRAAVLGQKAWNGVAILGRSEPVVTKGGLPGQESRGARLLTADVGGLSFTTIYCPNGKQISHDDFPMKLAWMDALVRHFEETHDPLHPTVLCGDFNVCPAPIDSWNEKEFHGRIHHTDEERARFGRLLLWGFHDLFREKFPTEQKFSWWDYRGGAFHRKQGLRIDFLLGTRSVLQRCRSVEVDRDYRKKRQGLIPSDHAPVIADLE